MLKAHIGVSAATKVPDELRALETKANDHGISGTALSLLLENARTVMTTFVKTAADMNVSGLHIEAKKTLEGDGFRVTFAVEAEGPKAKKKSGPLSWILGG